LIPEADDAFGRALLDYSDGKEVVTPVLETRGGGSCDALHPEWFFRAFAAWDWWDRALLPSIESGPVLDLGCGAGRASLYFQERGLEVTAVDASPGAVEVCRRRGVRDVRLGDLTDPPADRPWAAILLLCGNLGLGGSWEGNRRLLARLAQIARRGAILIGDSVTPAGRPEVVLRLRYGSLTTPWWNQCNVPAGEVARLTDGTGWHLRRQLVNGCDHAVVLQTGRS